MDSHGASSKPFRSFAANSPSIIPMHHLKTMTDHRRQRPYWTPISTMPSTSVKLTNAKTPLRDGSAGANDK